MSVNLAEMLILKKSELLDLSPENPYNIDDVAIANLFARHHIKIIREKYAEIYSSKEWETLKKKIPRDVFHFRINTPVPKKIEVDLSIHEFLLKRFYQIKRRVLLETD